MSSLPFRPDRNVPCTDDTETVTASVVNVNRNSAPVEFTLEGLCTQNGLFFGNVYVFLRVPGP